MATCTPYSVLASGECLTRRSLESGSPFKHVVQCSGHSHLSSGKTILNGLHGHRDMDMGMDLHVTCLVGSVGVTAVADFGHLQAPTPT